VSADGDSKAMIGRRVRRHIRAELYDDSGESALGIAIYTLSDPRSIRDVRYVGQTRSPPRRFAQHLNAARLWLPDELPWWIESPKLRPLYAWIRELYAEERRMPVMVVTAWTGSIAEDWNRIHRGSVEWSKSRAYKRTAGKSREVAARTARRTRSLPGA